MRTAIGAFVPSQAARTVGDLMSAGLPEQQISVIAHEEGPAQASYAEIRSWIHGLYAMNLTDVGDVMAGGPFATRVARAPVLEALLDAGLPGDVAREYVEDVKQGGALILASVPDERLDDTLAIMNRHMGARLPQPLRGEASRAAEGVPGQPPDSGGGEAPVEPPKTATTQAAAPASSGSVEDGPTRKGQIEQASAKAVAYVEERSAGFRERFVRSIRRAFDRSMPKAKGQP